MQDMWDFSPIGYQHSAGGSERGSIPSDSALRILLPLMPAILSMDELLCGNTSSPYPKEQSHILPNSLLVNGGQFRMYQMIPTVLPCHQTDMWRLNQSLCMHLYEANLELSGAIFINSAMPASLWQRHSIAGRHGPC